jgi:hypothetical protein
MLQGQDNTAAKVPVVVLLPAVNAGPDNFLMVRLANPFVNNVIFEKRKSDDINRIHATDTLTNQCGHLRQR